LRVPERDRFLLGDAPLMASTGVVEAMSPWASGMFNPEAASTALAFCFPSRIALLSCDALSGPLTLVGALGGCTAPSPLMPFRDAPWELWAESGAWEVCVDGEVIAVRASVRAAGATR
jgi:hypothetical protein